jgi:glycosyltransferase involved in cell wall biosynthesis
VKKLAVITTHPIQYYAPVFRTLTKNGKIQVKVFYTWERGAENFDKGFGKEVSWDIPLLDGYEHEFVSNDGSRAKDFRGVRNPELISTINRYNPDAVLVYGWNYASHLRAMRYYKGKKPVLFRGDSTLLDEKANLKRIIRRQLLRWVYSHIDMALYVGANNKAYFEKHGLAKNKLHFVPHAIDNCRFIKDEAIHQATANSLLQNAGINDDAIRVVYVGKLLPKKNPELLVDVFSRPVFNSMRLILVGDGELKEILEQKAKNSRNIHFLPFQNQSVMPAVYRMGDIFCLPSRGPGETWGLAVNEAMACGRAVLVSDQVGCACDLVVNGTNGYIFQSGNAASLHDCLLKLKDRNLLHAMGQRSKEMISDWSIEKQAEAIEKIISQL